MSHLYPNAPKKPLPIDQPMSIKHHLDSIGYNVHHAADHVKATTKRLDALKKFAPDVAAAQGKKVLTETQEMVDNVKPYTKGAKPMMQKMATKLVKAKKNV